LDFEADPVKELEDQILQLKRLHQEVQDQLIQQLNEIQNQLLLKIGELQDRYDQQAKRLECEICMDDEINTANYPCGHLYCSNCSKMMSYCGKCRKKSKKD
jgi:hypothetical protein